MGVKTTEFGPRGWRFLEGLARAYDEHPSPKLMNLFIEILTIFPSIIPCIYCRISFRWFTDPRKPASPEADIRAMLLKGQARRLVWAIHNCVSAKLRAQELAEHPRNKAKINAKWDEKKITYKNALKEHYPAIRSTRFWNAYTIFTAFVMCDYKPAECNNYLRFFRLVGEFMMHAGLEVEGSHFLESLAQTEPVWGKVMDIERRLDIIWCIHKRMCDMFDYDYGMTRKQLRKACDFADAKECAK